MRKYVFRLLFVSLLAVWGMAVSAQTTVTGTVVDAETNEPLLGAAVIQSGTSLGVVTDIDGKFTINLPSIPTTLVFKSLGYKEVQRKITQSERQNLVIEMEINAVALADVTITSSIAIDRETPVALSAIPPQFIEERIGIKEFPELLKSTPGVTVIRDGGGFGDSKLNVRGFQSANVAVMVNGVPMNDMEWGGVYWSNWLGLQDVTRVMQTQRGIGASKVSAPSVGGSVNIVTRTIDAQKGGFVNYGVAENGYNKLLFSVSTGLTKDGWAFTILGGKTWGDGYVQGAEFEGYEYFVNIAKRFNDSHQLSLTAFGAPQWHNQRSTYDGLSVKNWQAVQQYMEPGENYKYNATYGFGKNGERKTSARNKYHKPQISLNHMWDINNKSSLSTALYVSLGDGYGYSGQGTDAYRNSWFGTTNGVVNTQFRNADGTFAYDQIQDMNEQSVNGSQMVMSVSKNLHKWYGLLSTYTNQLTDEIEVFGGIDGRYYIGTHTNEIIDLYNGAYYIDRNRASVLPANNSAASSPDFKNKKLTVGDVVFRDYDGYVTQIGVFGQGEYKKEKLSALISGSLSNVSQWRDDRFYYDAAHAKSETVSKIGFTAKGGANYNLNEYHNVFANLGYISRAPFFSGGIFLQSTTSNAVNTDAVNEKVISAELGYGFRSKFLSANLNVYHTEWNDKTMASPLTGPAPERERGTLNMTGINATHEGIELDFTSAPLPWLDLTGMLSIGNWRWTNNGVGYAYNSSGQPITKDWTVASGIEAPDHAKIEIDLEGVKVGGSAQTTGMLGAKFKLDKNIYVGLDWTLIARNYADFTFNSGTTLDTKIEVGNPWSIPTASYFDFYAGYGFKIGALKANLSGNISNIFDQEYIESAWDGTSHDWQSATRVFYGFGRQMSMKLKVSF